MSVVIKCLCGKEILDDNIEYQNFSCCEDYFRIFAKCECGKDYEVEGWGNLDNLEEAKEELKYYIEEK